MRFLLVFALLVVYMQGGYIAFKGCNANSLSLSSIGLQEMPTSREVAITSHF